jgi:DNA ligase-associated metallophosphoesterase
VIAIEQSGERLQLLPERALSWPRRRTVFIADAHFGKDAHFRRAGIPIPAGPSRGDLERLGSIVDTCAAERLIVLGDFLHADPDPAEPFLEAFRAWRRQRSSLDLAAVIGNHDRHGGVSRLNEGLRWLEDGRNEGPFVLRHEPEASPDGYVLAGHLHPVIRLRGPGGDRLRLPVFWFARRFAVLPSFGTFTGGYAIRHHAGDRVFAAGPDGVLDVSRPAAASHG